MKFNYDIGINKCDALFRLNGREEITIYLKRIGRVIIVFVFRFINELFYLMTFFYLDGYFRDFNIGKFK